MIVHPFYRDNSLRLHEIKPGLKCPVEVGWPDTTKTADDVEPLLDGERFNKYGWILDDVHVVIDIDVHDEKANGYEALEKLEADLGYQLADVCGAIVETPSGGRHYYFTKPADVNFGKVFKDKYPGIDFINGRGKQVIAANSRHDKFEGTYQLPPESTLKPVPRSLIDHLCELRPAKPPPAPTVEMFEDRAGDEFNRSEGGLRMLMGEMESRGYTFRDCGDYWEFDRPGKTTDSKCSGHVGKRSKLGNYQLTSFSLSDDYFPSGESMAIFHAFTLIVGGDHRDAASKLYDNGFAKQDLSGIDISKLLVGLERGDGFDDEDFARSCVPESGLLREVYDYYCLLSHRKSDVMGLAVAVSLCETLFGRRVASHTDLRTNDYNVIVAPTNCGKEACEKTIVKIFEAADPENNFLVPSDVQSGNGIMKAMSTSRCALWIADEFGKVLSSILDKKQKSSHMVQVATHLLKMYGKADAVYLGAAHSDGIRNQIVQPHLCVLGLTTSSTLFESVDASNVLDGLFGRIAFWPVQTRPKRRDMVKTNPPEELVAKVRRWMDWTPGGNLGNECPDPPAIEMSPEALERWKSHSDAIDRRMESEKETKAAIWGRVAARSMKLALVHMAARQTGDPAQIAWDLVEIEIEDVNWGIRVSNWLARIACDLVDQNFVDLAANKNRAFIMNALDEFGEVKVRDILRACRRMTCGEVMAEATLLANAGIIEIVTMKSGKAGRPSIVLKKLG